MLSNFIVVEYCYRYLVDQIPLELLLYSHIPTALSALLFGGYVLYKVKDRTSAMLFAVCFLFTAWCIFDLGSWFAFLGPGSTMFTWSLIDLVSILIFFFTYYFLYSFLTKNDLPKWQKYASAIIILPIIAYTFLGIHLPIYDANSCAAIENEIITKYLYFAEAIFIFTTLILIYKSYKNTKISNDQHRVVLVGIGVLTFLIFFFSATLAVSLLAESDASLYVYNYEIYGLFGMPVLLIFLGYLIVRYKAFDLKVFGVQALVTGLIVLIASEFTFVTTLSGQILVGITLLIMSVVGTILIKSVKKEIKLREQVEGLVVDLGKANERLKILDKMKSEFVSIASHQLRSPLTSIRGYASMLVEGTYGKLPEKAVDALKNISDSARFMAQSVEDYLNVSRIEAGNMKYELSDFNLKEQAEKIVDEMRQVVMKAGLVLLFRSENTGNMIVHADIGKTRQVINNIIDNAMKYTPHGTITVIAHDDIKQKKAIITIHDTGIGMDEDTLNGVFNKFVRAKNANSVNTSGTGLGLYVAKIMVEKMGGTVWAESEGQGKGSTFHIEFPLLNGKERP